MALLIRIYNRVLSRCTILDKKKKKKALAPLALPYEQFDYDY